MSDDESPEPGSAETGADEQPAAEPVRRKRKARPVSERAAVSVAKPATRTAIVTAPVSQWTTGHLAAALALGLALGGGGGYLAGSKSGPGATAEANLGAASGSAAGANAGAKQQPPAAGAYVPLAAWTPREGPEQAKVTIVEFSDFQ